MFKRGICLILAFLLSVSICACSKKASSGGDESTAASQSEQAQSSAADSEQEGTSEKEDAASEKGDTKQSGKKGGSAGQGGGEDSDSSGSGQSGQQEGTTAPVTKQEPTKAPTSKKNTVDLSFTIDCSAAVGIVGGVPDSGYYLNRAGVSVGRGATVYDALVKCCDANGVSVVASKTMYGMYVSAIGGLAEKEAGKTSGWTYTVNGKYPPKACDKYTPEDGDKINFIYKAD